MLCVLLCPILSVACSDGSSNDGSNTPTNGEDGNTPSNGGGGGGSDAGTGSGRGDAGSGGGGGNQDGGGSTPDSGSGPTTPPSGTDAASICFDKINAYRATLNLPPYARWTDNETCANGQSKSDSESGQAHGAFGKCTEMAQNECPGWGGPPEKMIPDCLAQMWAEGPGDDFSKHGHYTNMSSKSYTKVACGFYTMPNGKVWAVQDFR